MAPLLGARQSDPDAQARARSTLRGGGDGWGGGGGGGGGGPPRGGGGGPGIQFFAPFILLKIFDW